MNYNHIIYILNCINTPTLSNTLIKTRKESFRCNVVGTHLQHGPEGRSDTVTVRRAVRGDSYVSENTYRLAEIQTIRDFADTDTDDDKAVTVPMVVKPKVGKRKR